MPIRVNSILLLSFVSKEGARTFAKYRHKCECDVAKQLGFCNKKSLWTLCLNNSDRALVYDTLCDHLIHTEEILKNLLAGYFYTVPIKTESKCIKINKQIGKKRTVCNIHDM